MIDFVDNHKCCFLEGDSASMQQYSMTITINDQYNFLQICVCTICFTLNDEGSLISKTSSSYFFFFVFFIQHIKYQVLVSYKEIKGIHLN